jgi:hypothetical protein
VSCGLTITTSATCTPTIRAISAALPVASKATRSLGARLAANSSSAAGVVGTRPEVRDPAAISDRDLAEVAVHVHPDSSEHIALLTSTDTKREQEGNTTQTDPRSERNRASRRGGQ